MAKIEMSRVETLHYENLINDNKYPILTAARELNSGAGALKRGTALQVNADGATLEKMTNGGTASAILAEDAAEGGGVAVVYLTGQFNRQKVDEITGITLTDADVEKFRALGIYLNYADTNAVSE